MLSTSKLFFNPSAGGAKDPYFPYVPLLLETTSTNGQQNNTFLDSSTNNFTITRNGTPTQGSVTPYWPNGYWSNNFNGSSDYLSVADNAAFNFGTGDATVEFWFSSPSQNTNNFPGIISSVAYNTAGSASIRFDNTGNKGKIFMYINGGGDPVIVSASTVAYGTWTHVAIVRQTTSLKLYLNGSLDATATISSSLGWYFSAGGLRIGRGFDVDTTNAYFSGTVSNIRLVKGVAVYTGAFTVPTTPLAATQSGNGSTIQAITGTQTSLLTCQSNRFVDNGVANTGGTGFPITANGTPKVQAFQPFSPPASYTAAAYGGSGYFVRASSQYLTTTNPSSQFSFGTGALTIECWVYLSSLPSTTGYPGSYWMFGGGPLNSNPGIDFYINNTQIGFNLVDFTTPTAIGNHGMVVGAWYHLAVVRGGTLNQTVSIYVNGTRVATAAAVVATADPATTGIAISAAEPSGSTGGNLDGYIANYRVVKGTAVYDPTLATLTVPTSPVTAVTNTQLLLNFTNAGIYDAAVQNNAITVGSAQASTTITAKWPPTSMKFNGTTDYLSIPSNVALDCKTGDWTIECWVYVSSRTLNYPLVFGNNRGSFTTDALGITNSNADNVAYNDKFCLAWGSAGFSAQSAGTASLLVSSVTNSTGTWYYLAVVRSGTSVKIYRDGSQVANATVSSGATFNWGYNGTLIGGGNWDAANSYFSGYLQDLRVTKYARTITTPTAAFPTR